MLATDRSFRTYSVSEASWPRMARMAAPTSSRADWPISTFTYTHRNRPLPFSSSISASSAEVLPVWRGACRTKYLRCSMSKQDGGQIEPRQRRDEIVNLGIDRPCRIEEAHAGSVAPLPSLVCPTTCTGRGFGTCRRGNSTRHSSMFCRVDLFRHGAERSRGYLDESARSLRDTEDDEMDAQGSSARRQFRVSLEDCSTFG